MLAAVVLAAAVLLLGAGCSSDSSSTDTTVAAPTTAPPLPAGSAPVLVEQIRPAIAAVESALGGPQEYFEVNASPTLVNLFVAADDATQAVAYVYQSGELGAPATPQPASGPTFRADDLTFDETKVLAQVVGQLPNSNLLLFAASGVEGGGVAYSASVQSTLGGSFQVDLGPTGAILGTMGGIDPLDTIPDVLPSLPSTGS